MFRGHQILQQPSDSKGSKDQLTATALTPAAPAPAPAAPTAAASTAAAAARLSLCVICGSTVI